MTKNPLQISEKARELHAHSVVIDGHSDILMAIADGLVRLGEEMEIPDLETWEPPFPQPKMPFAMGEMPSKAAQHIATFGTAGQFSIPQFLRGGVTVETCAIYLEDHQLDRALQRALEMTWWLHKEAEENPNFELVTRAADIRRLKAEGKCGGILAFEGLEPLGNELRFLDLFYRLGLRMASITHNRRNMFGDGPQPGYKTGGLTALGKQAVRRMNELGIVLDLVHTNEACFYEALEITQARPIISHLHPFAFQRFRGALTQQSHAFDPVLDRPHLQALKQKGGVAAVTFVSMPTVESVADNILCLLDLMGPDLVAIGSDLYGISLSPRGLETMDRLPVLTDELLRRGLDDATIQKVLGENLMSVFEEVWK